MSKIALWRHFSLPPGLFGWCLGTIFGSLKTILNPLGAILVPSEVSQGPLWATLESPTSSSSTLGAHLHCLNGTFSSIRSHVGPPQMVSIFLKRRSPRAVIVIILLSLSYVLTVNFPHLRRPLAGNIPSMVLRIVRDTTWRMIVLLCNRPFDFSLLLCVLAIWFAWTFQSQSISCDTDLTGSPMIVASVLPNRLGGRTKPKQFRILHPRIAFCTRIRNSNSYRSRLSNY